MELTENYDSLKRRFEELGYRSARLENDLRQGLATGKDHFAASINEEFTRIVFWSRFEIIRSDSKGEFEVLGYEAAIRQYDQANYDLSFYFSPDVSMNDACQVLAKKAFASTGRLQTL